jgi:hypothetical protein
MGFCVFVLADLNVLQQVRSALATLNRASNGPFRAPHVGRECMWAVQQTGIDRDFCAFENFLRGFRAS